MFCMQGTLVGLPWILPAWFDLVAEWSDQSLRASFRTLPDATWRVCRNQVRTARAAHRKSFWVELTNIVDLRSADPT